MPGFDGTGPKGQGGRTGRGQGRCGGRGTGTAGAPQGGGRRRLQMRNGMGMQQPEASAPIGASSGATQRSGLLASGQEVAELKQQVQQLTETVRVLTQKRNESPPASSEA